MERIWTGGVFDCSLEGDLERAADLERDARICAGFLFDQLMPVQTYATGGRQEPDGSLIEVHVWRDVLGERVQAHIWGAGESSSLLPTENPAGRYVWLPEGFIITPKSVIAPRGWGLPKIDADGEPINPPWGTANGPLREVLVNRFANNKYLPAGKQPLWLYWPLTYTIVGDPKTEFDLPGDYPDSTAKKENGDAADHIDQFAPQFVLNPEFGLDPDGESWVEVEGEEWVAHRVEEQEYLSEFAAEVLRLTNELRLSLGRTAVYRPLRGFADAARMAALCNLQEGYLGHESEGFPAGYAETVARLWKDGMTPGGRENLGATWGMSGKSAVDLAAEFFDGWVDSPRHYENMVAEDLDYDKGQDNLEPGVEDESKISQLQVALAGPGTLKGEIDPDTNAKTDFSTPHGDANIAAQVFAPRHRWLEHGTFYWTGDAGTVSWDMRYFEQYTNHHAMFRCWFDQAHNHLYNYPEDDYLRDEVGYIYLWGRKYEAPNTLDAVPRKMRCYGAALSMVDVSETDVPNLVLHVVAAMFNRVAAALEFFRTPVYKLAWYRWEKNEDGFHDPLPWGRYATFAVADDMQAISMVRFSQDGTKAVWRVEQESAAEYSAIVIETADGLSGDGVYNSDGYNDDALLPRKVNENWFYELTNGDNGWVATALDREDGVSVVVTITADSFVLQATGDFPIAMDYLNNALVAVRGEVNDLFEYHQDGSTWNTQRNFLFPSGKTFVYESLRTNDCATTAPSFITSIDYLNVQTEDVVGWKMLFESKRVEEYFDGTPYDPANPRTGEGSGRRTIVHPVRATFSLFANTAELDKKTVVGENAFGRVWAPSWFVAGPNIALTFGTSFGYWGGFVPVPTSSDMIGNGAAAPNEVVINMAQMCSEAVADYAQYPIAPRAGRFFERLYGGLGIYNPMPHDGRMSYATAQRYKGELIAGAYNGVADISEYIVFEPWYTKTIMGYTSTLPLTQLVGKSLYQNDLFPIGKL